MIRLKKDYSYAHDGIRVVDYKEGQETDELPNEIESILIERGDACECSKKKEKAVEPKKEAPVEKKEEKIEEPKESPKEPEENKLVQPKEDKVKKSPKKTKKAKK